MLTSHARMHAHAQVITAVSVLALALLSTEVNTTDEAKVQADAVKVRETLTGMGATFIKVGQVLANRPDIIRADYMDELTKLQVRAPQIEVSCCICHSVSGAACPSPLLARAPPFPLSLYPSLIFSFPPTHRSHTGPGPGFSIKNCL